MSNIKEPLLMAPLYIVQLENKTGIICFWRRNEQDDMGLESKAL